MVKDGRRPPSTKLLSILEDCIKPEKSAVNYYELFMQSHPAKEVSPATVRFYEVKLGRFLEEINPDKAKQHHVEKFLLQFKNPGNRQRYYQVIKTFFIWREQTPGLPNITKYMHASKVGKLLLPSLTKEQVEMLIEYVTNARDKAIIALFTESGLRLSELARIKDTDIDWDNHTIRIIGRGRKEAYCPSGALSEGYLREWLSQNKSNGNILYCTPLRQVEE